MNTKCFYPNLRPDSVELKRPRTEVARFQHAGVQHCLIQKRCQKSYLQAECRKKHFWQFLIIAISWKYVRRRPICFETAPRVGAFHSPAIFAVLHWSFVFEHQTLLCCCLILLTISVGRKSKDRSFWWCSLREVNTSRRCVLDDQWRQYTNYSCMRIPVDGPPTRVHVSGSLLALLTYEYPAEYGLSFECKVDVHWFNKLFWPITTGCILPSRKQLEICKCPWTITPSTLDFAGKLAFVHGVISILSATLTDC